MSSSSPSESPCVISLEDGDSNASVCMIAETPSSPQPIKYKKDKRPLIKPWGEYDPVDEEDDATTLAIIKDIKKKAILGVSEPVVVDEQESFYLLFPPSLSVCDERVLHSIKLQEYARNIKTMIENINTDAIEEAYPPAPDIPVASGKIQDRCSFFPDIRMERDATNFSVGRPEPNLNLPIPCARVLLGKAIETLLAHHSFTEASETALNVLVDIVEHLLLNLGERLRIAADQEDMTGNCGFNSITERVLTETNLGSLDEIIEYYQSMIICIHSGFEKECNKLAKSYSDRVKDKVDGLIEQTDQVEIHIPTDEEEYEEEEDEEDIPEIHFPALDEDDQLGLQPSLETGFQMLDSLEHDEALQNLDPDEEISVDSPSQEFMLSVISELSNTLEFSKGKRKRKKT